MAALSRTGFFCCFSHIAQVALVALNLKMRHIDEQQDRPLIMTSSCTSLLTPLRSLTLVTKVVAPSWVSRVDLPAPKLPRGFGERWRLDHA